MSNHDFILGKIAEDFEATARQIITCMAGQGPAYQRYSDAIHDQLAECQRDKLIRVAFVGQYSSGKSTIISALTGRQDIKIDADIATDRATDYDWNGILLTDTPGLFTERKDHDTITYTALASADLLAFVITSDLFDSVILNNFLKLAYEQNYRHKLLLVINKMSMESGRFEDLTTTYTQSLQQALQPYPLSDFRLAFMDAADFLEGIGEGDTNLIEMSNFTAFVAELNGFVAAKGILGRLDTPIRAVISHLDQALLAKQTDAQSRTFFALLERIEKRVNRNLLDARSELKRAVLKLRAEIIGISHRLVAKIGDSGVDFDAEMRTIEIAIQTKVNVASGEVEHTFVQLREDLTNEIAEILTSDLGHIYLEDIAASGIDVTNPHLSDNGELRRNFETLQTITKRVSSGVLDLANGAGIQGFLKSGDVAGSRAHEIVYDVGKFFGVKFKPWGAVNFAKNAANVFKFVGPALAIIAVVIDIKDWVEQEVHNRELIAARRQCTTEFVGVAEQVEQQFNTQFEEYKHSFYDEVLMEIARRRDEAIHAQIQTSTFQQELAGYKNRLNNLLLAIYQ